MIQQQDWQQPHCLLFVLLANIHEENNFHEITEQLNAEQGEEEAEQEEETPAGAANSVCNPTFILPEIKRKKMLRNRWKEWKMLVDIGGNVTISIGQHSRAALASGT